MYCTVDLCIVDQMNVCRCRIVRIWFKELSHHISEMEIHFWASHFSRDERNVCFFSFLQNVETGKWNKNHMVATLLTKINNKTIVQNRGNIVYMLSQVSEWTAAKREMWCERKKPNFFHFANFDRQNFHSTKHEQTKYLAHQTASVFQVFVSLSLTLTHDATEWLSWR